MLTWLCTLLPLSGCTESETNISQAPQVKEPQFSIQDVRSPLLTPENCLTGSVLQMVKTDSLERYFCANKEGVLVGPSIEKQLSKTDGAFKYTWYTDGKLSHVPLMYTNNGLLDFDTTEKLLLQSRQVTWFKEWLDYQPKFLENPQATIFALQYQIISLETALKRPLEKNSCTKNLPQNMTCYPSDVFMIEPDKELKSSQKKWQIHAVTTFYADTKTISTDFLDNCSKQCNCSEDLEDASNHDSNGRVSWRVAQEICEDKGKRLPTYAELLQIQKQNPFEDSEWLISDLEKKDASLNIYDWRDIEISTKHSKYALFTSNAKIETYAPEQGQKANFRCVSDHIQTMFYGSEWVEISQMPQPKMNTMRGYGDAWYRKDAGYRETVLNWDEFGKGYIEDRAAVKDTYILSHSIHRLHKKYPKNIQIFQITHSHFGNPIYAIKVSKEPDSTSPKNIASADILHLGAVHGNEIFTTNALLNGIEDLLNKKKYATYLENYNFWFVPMVNPDGNWMAMRKAMAKSFGYKNGQNTEGSCKRRAFEGVNLSENFPDLISPYPENIVLEPETQGILQLMDKLQLVAVVSFHSGESNIFVPSSFKESSKNQARSGMSFFMKELDTALQKEDFELPIKNLKDEEHEISHLFAKTGVPSLVIDYPKDVFYETWEKRSYVQKKYEKILDIYWDTLLSQRSVIGFIKNKGQTPIGKTDITVVELGENQPVSHTQQDGFFYVSLPNLETVTLRIESEGFVPVEKKIKVKDGLQKSLISLVEAQNDK
jgi:hypothetical protein